MKRVLTAAALLPIFIWTVIAKNPLYWTALLCLAAFLGAIEFFKMAEANGIGVFKRSGILMTLGLVASSVWPDELHTNWVIAAGIICLLALGLSGRRELGALLASVSVTFFGAFYMGFLIGYFAALKAEGTEAGKDLIFLAALTTWAGDTAAYYTGRAFGKHKLAPSISPKKTWEGAAGNLAGSLIAAFIASQTFIHKIQGLHGLHVMVLGLTLSVVGQVGDLCESALKRGSGIKDSSSLLPGHGGIMDRLDSLLFNAPVVYYYHRVFLQ